MTATVQDIERVIQEMVPTHLAASWDNVGLQVGDRRWPVSHIWVALDPMPGVVQAAINAGADMLVTHHPLFFRPISTIDLSAPAGRIVQSAIGSKMAIFAAHTNLDAVQGGLNDMLAERMGLDRTTPLQPADSEPDVKLVVFVPAGYETRIIKALTETPAGKIGNYTNCSFRVEGVGAFVPGTEAAPWSGHPGEMAAVAEYRVEVRVRRRDIESTLASIRSVHPYDEMAYDLYALEGQPAAGQGIGRIGTLADPLPLEAFAARLAEQLGSRVAPYIGDPRQPVQTVALCGGSGSSLLPDFYRSGADVFVTGDLGYHDARDIEMRGKCAVNIGHFASEHLFIDPFCDMLQAALRHHDQSVSVTPCAVESDPFQYAAVAP